jgi:hypothetical protein
MQGISPNRPSLAKIRLENICKSSYLWTNSLRRRAGNRNAGNVDLTLGTSRRNVAITSEVKLEGKRTAMGRKALILGSALVAFILGAASAYAFGGGPNLPLVDSPYAILEPQTVAPLSKQPPNEVNSNRMGRGARRLRPRRQPAGIR